MSEYEGVWTRADNVKRGQVFKHEGKQYNCYKVIKMGKRTSIVVNESGSLVIRLENWRSVDVIGEW